MKQCPECKLSKDFSFFSKNKNKKDGLQRICKVCVAEQSKKSYNKIPDNYKNRAKKQNEKTVDFVFKYIQNRSCCKCGDKRYWILDFHHIDPTIKKANIGNLKRSGCTQKLIEEINKCILLCKNCHYDFHYMERSYKINIIEYIQNNTKLNKYV